MVSGPFDELEDEEELELEDTGHATLPFTRYDPSPAPQPFRLLVVEGPDAGKTFALEPAQPSLIGTSASCDVRLSDRTVSRRHTSLDIDGHRVRIADLDSKNGTRVNGLAIIEGYLEGGELVRLGATGFRVERDDSGAAAGSSLTTATSFGRVLGASTEMRRLYPVCEKLAKSDVPVVVEGETGTGKELLAESLHEQGLRAGKPFVVFDCTAVPSNLVEAELFGHERGAFTGAVTARPGLLALANGGTLFIDEIGDLELSLQPKLLRVIERQEIRSLGSNRVLRVDVRIIAATRRDLDRAVQAGHFRDDLFHRLAVARIELPPLRRRKGDVLLLAHHFWRELGGDAGLLSTDLLGRLAEHSWPGNVRELRNSVARYLALGELANLARDSLAGAESSTTDAALHSFLEEALELPLGEARQKVVEEFERHYIARLLSRHGGNVTRAAESAGIARRYLQILKARRNQ